VATSQLPQSGVATRPMVQKLLNLEQFYQQRINKRKTYFFGEIGLLLVLLESPY